MNLLWYIIESLYTLLHLINFSKNFKKFIDAMYEKKFCVKMLKDIIYKGRHLNFYLKIK